MDKKRWSAFLKQSPKCQSFQPYCIAVQFSNTDLRQSLALAKAFLWPVQLDGIPPSIKYTALTEMCSLDFKNIVITTREWAPLRELCLILGPFAEATELTEGEKIIAIRMVVPTVLDLNTHLIHMDSPKSFCRPLIRALRESLQQRCILIARDMAEPEDHSFNALFSHEIYAQAPMLESSVWNELGRHGCEDQWQLCHFKETKGGNTEVSDRFVCPPVRSCISYY